MLMLGERLRQLRIEKGYTQIELAEVANVGQSMIAQIESGQKQASAPIIAALAKKLGVSADYLVFGESA